MTGSLLITSRAKTLFYTSRRYKAKLHISYLVSTIETHTAMHTSINPGKRYERNGNFKKAWNHRRKLANSSTVAHLSIYISKGFPPNMAKFSSMTLNWLI